MRAELLECKQELDREKQESAHELGNLWYFIEGIGGRPGALNDLADPEDLQMHVRNMHDFEDFVCVVQPPNEIVKVVRVDDVRHTHDSISRKFKDGQSFADLINDLNHDRLDPLRESFLKLEVVEWPGQGLFALNNRRLFCLKRHQEDIRRNLKMCARVRTLPDSFVKMTQDPLTWPLCEKFIKAYDSRSAGCSIMVRDDRMYEWPSRARSEYCKRATGTIKTWDVYKQFGFVLCGSEELFLHVARMTKPDETESVQTYGLAEGDRVEFEEDARTETQSGILNNQDERLYNNKENTLLR